ncbi:MAG TPA: glycosyltransferase [Gaiellaceae bacterium]
MRILVVAPFPPSSEGEHGGSRSIAQRLTRIAKRHEVFLLHFRRVTDAPLGELSAGLDSEAVELRAWHSRPRLFRALRAAFGLLGGTPLWATELASHELARRLGATVERFRPDVVQFEYAPMAQYAKALPGRAVPRVLVDHDADREASVIQDPRRSLLRRADRAAWRRFERRVLSEVDATVVFTERDRAVLASRVERPRVSVIPIGIDAVDDELVTAASAPEILFVGNFVHPPNLDAATRLARAILPLVRGRVPEATLTIVGPGSPAELSTEPGVTVTGYVESVRPFYERAAAVAVPIAFGGGMRVKVMEALAVGVPVVASSLALEGLDVRDGEHVLVAGSDAAFADAVVRLFQDPALGSALRARGAAWARANLGWDNVVASYDALYDELVRARPATRPHP